MSMYFLIYQEVVDSYGDRDKAFMADTDDHIYWGERSLKFIACGHLLIQGIKTK